MDGCHRDGGRGLHAVPELTDSQGVHRHPFCLNSFPPLGRGGRDWKQGPKPGPQPAQVTLTLLVHAEAPQRCCAVIAIAVDGQVPPQKAASSWEREEPPQQQREAGTGSLGGVKAAWGALSWCPDHHHHHVPWKGHSAHPFHAPAPAAEGTGRKPLLSWPPCAQRGLGFFSLNLWFSYRAF